MTIMLIDDDPIVLESLKSALQLNEFQVVTFISPLPALEVFHQDKEMYDVVITDFHLQEMDGIQVMKRVFKESPQTHVIVISGDRNSSLAKRTLQVGARAFLTKPLDIDHLIDRLKRLQSSTPTS